VPRDLRHSATGAVRAKLFRNGRSQAVRLPKAFRFEGDEVLVRRDGDAVILEPVGKRAWPKGYWARVTRLRRALELGDVPRMGATLLDLPAEEA
jgi:virulence-associated protein VagC